MNQFRKKPKLLSKRLENLRPYLDTQTNVLSEPNKTQIQMVEGDTVFKEAITYLKNLPPLDSLEWSDSLASSAMEHVNDIGPKGLLSYQSSDGTEPEDRIAKYGTFSTSLGENIDFGPNDAIGVIISMTLDDGEEQRPHRENLFKADYHKVGIACGRHKTEFHMCVMDFAFDFTPIANQVKPTNNKKVVNNPVTKITNNEPNEIISNSNQSPLVKLSLEPEMISRVKKENTPYNINSKQTFTQEERIIPKRNNVRNDDFDNLTKKTKNLINNMKIIEKKVEVFTKVIYIYEDNSRREVTDSQTHTFKY